MCRQNRHFTYVLALRRSRNTGKIATWIMVFANKTKSRFINLLENELEQLRAVGGQISLKIEFSIVRQNGVRETMSHYFQQNANAIKDKSINFRKNQGENRSVVRVRFGLGCRKNSRVLH